MDEPEVELAPTLDGALTTRVRTLNWRELARAGEHETSKEWHRHLLDANLLVEGSRAAADGDLKSGDPRREIVAVHRAMQQLMASEARHEELSAPAPWNSGAVRLGATGTFLLLMTVYCTGLAHHGPVATLSFLCLGAVVAMWGDILNRHRKRSAEWQHRLRFRERLGASVVRLGTRSWVAPLGREVVENTPHLDLLATWKREIKQDLSAWQAKLDALAPLEDVEGLPAALIDESRPAMDPVVEAETRRRLDALKQALARVDALEQDVVATLDAHRRLAATGELPALDGLGFDLDEVAGWLRVCDVDPDRGGGTALVWLRRRD